MPEGVKQKYFGIFAVFNKANFMGVNAKKLIL